MTSSSSRPWFSSLCSEISQFFEGTSTSIEFALSETVSFEATEGQVITDEVEGCVDGVVTSKTVDVDTVGFAATKGLVRTDEVCSCVGATVISIAAGVDTVGDDDLATNISAEEMGVIGGFNLFEAVGAGEITGFLTAEAEAFGTILTKVGVTENERILIGVATDDTTVPVESLLFFKELVEFATEVLTGLSNFNCLGEAVVVPDNIPLNITGRVGEDKCAFVSKDGEQFPPPLISSCGKGTTNWSSLS